MKALDTSTLLPTSQSPSHWLFFGLFQETRRGRGSSSLMSECAKVISSTAVHTTSCLELYVSQGLCPALLKQQKGHKQNNYYACLLWLICAYALVTAYGPGGVHENP